MAETTYSNTDLEIVSNEDLSELALVFSKTCSVVSCCKGEDSRWHAIVEFGDSADSSFDEDGKGLIEVVESFKGDNLVQWRTCVKRNFNIGFECGNTWAYMHSISAELLARVVAADCTISITLYPFDSDQHCVRE